MGAGIGLSPALADANAEAGADAAHLRLAGGPPLIGDKFPLPLPPPQAAPLAPPFARNWIPGFTGIGSAGSDESRH